MAANFHEDILSYFLQFIMQYMKILIEVRSVEIHVLKSDKYKLDIGLAHKTIRSHFHELRGFSSTDVGLHVLDF